jgi:hypothetical protein
MGKVLHHPLRSLGAALTVVGTGFVFVLLVLPAVAFGDSPNGKLAVKQYFNQRGQKTVKLNVSKWFEIGGAHLNNAVQVYCRETLSAQTFTPVADFNIVSSKLIDHVYLSPDCVGSRDSIVVQFSGPDGVAGDDAFGDAAGDPGDDILVYGPVAPISGSGGGD